MRTAIYIRVSTEDQAKEGFSLEAQKALLERKAAEWELTIVKHYIDDGYSASSMKRPALQSLLADAEKRLFDVVLYWRLDRLTRKSRDFHHLTEKLSKFEVGIKSATEPIDTTTAIGRFQLELSVSLAQLERETISERVHFVMEERTRKGLRNGSIAPYGYDLVEGQLVINQEQAEIVRKIFNLYLDGKGMKGIAHTLTREGIPSPSTKALWSSAGVKYILDNPVYVNKLRYNYANKKVKKSTIISDGQHEHIIDDETYERVQVESNRRKFGGKRFTSDHIFSAVLRCGRCGGTFSGMSYRKGIYRYYQYRCNNRVDHGTCDFPSVAEGAVVRAFLESIDFTKVDFEKHFEGPDNEEEERKRVESIHRELEAIGRRRKKWQLAYANDALTLEELKEHTEEDRLREEFIRKQLDTVSDNTKTYWNKDEIISLLRNMSETWYLVDNNKLKKQSIQEIYEYIIIDVHPESKLGQGARIKLKVHDAKYRL